MLHPKIRRLLSDLSHISMAWKDWATTSYKMRQGAFHPAVHCRIAAGANGGNSCAIGLSFFLQLRFQVASWPWLFVVQVYPIIESNLIKFDWSECVILDRCDCCKSTIPVSLLSLYPFARGIWLHEHSSSSRMYRTYSQYNGQDFQVDT